MDRAGWPRIRDHSALFEGRILLIGTDAQGGVDPRSLALGRRWKGPDRRRHRAASPAAPLTGRRRDSEVSRGERASGERCPRLVRGAAGRGPSRGWRPDTGTA